MPEGKSPNEGNRKYSVDQMREALSKAGTKNGAAKLLKTDRKTICRYILENPTLSEALYDAKQNLLDQAESGLMKNVSKGHPSSIFFTLKTLGKERGYVERVENTGADGAPLFNLDTAKQTLKDKFKK